MPIIEQYTEILTVLERHHVQYLVVGGVAAVLNGVPLVTFDLDILHSRDEANLPKLIAALHELDAHYRHDSRHLTPNESHLRGPGHQLLTTKFGALDVLGSIQASTTYTEAVSDSSIIDFEGLRVPVLGLRTLIAAKEYAGRPKDLAALPTIRATLDEIMKRQG